MADVSGLLEWRCCRQVGDSHIYLASSEFEGGSKGLELLRQGRKAFPRFLGVHSYCT